MADTVTLYHPALGRTIEVSPSRARVLLKSGWETPKPRKRTRKGGSNAESN